MTATNVNYQKHYRGFCDRLKKDPTIKISVYCEEVGINWRRLYDWMTRRNISLKRLYAGYEQPVPESERSVVGNISKPQAFAPLKIESPAMKEVSTVCKDLRIKLPSGVSVNIGECDAEFLVRILGGPIGKDYV